MYIYTSHSEHEHNKRNENDICWIMKIFYNFARSKYKNINT